MKVLEQIWRKRQRTEGPGVPAILVVPVMPRPVLQVDVVDVEAEPDTTSPSNIPPVTEPAREEPFLAPRTTVLPKSGDKGKVLLGLDGPPLVIYPEIPEGERDEENQKLVRHYEA